MFNRKRKFEKSTTPFFLQRFTLLQKGADRYGFLCQEAKGKRVLHIGCADWPIFNSENNLHVKLASVSAALVGVDPQEEALQLLKDFDSSLHLFPSLESVRETEFDLVLIPEVLEHVGNVEHFFSELARLKFSEAIITVPDAFSCRESNFYYDNVTSEYLEIVHPDHNCWYSPATLAQTISKYSPFTIKQLFTVSSSVGAIISYGK